MNSHGPLLQSITFIPVPPGGEGEPEPGHVNFNCWRTICYVRLEDWPELQRHLKELSKPLKG